jgi:hypothetical protein
MNHEQIEEQIEAQITDAVRILDRLSQNTTNSEHRVLVERIIIAAVLIHEKAMSAGKGGE